MSHKFAVRIRVLKHSSHKTCALNILDWNFLTTLIFQRPIIIVNSDVRKGSLMGIRQPVYLVQLPVPQTLTKPTYKTETFGVCFSYKKFILVVIRDY